MVPVFLDAMMGKELEHRYQSASQIIEDLRAFRDGQTPTHLSAIRKKKSDGSGTVFEVVVPEKNMMAASKGQSLVTDLLVDTESSIPAPVIIKPDSQLPSILGKSLAGIAGAVILIVLFWGIGNAMQQGEATQPNGPPPTTTQPPPGPPPAPQPRQPSNDSQFYYAPDGSAHPLPLDPSGTPGMPYPNWTPGQRLPAGWSPPGPGGPGGPGGPPANRRPPPWR
jgi:hypothetical protein